VARSSRLQFLRALLLASLALGACGAEPPAPVSGDDMYTEARSEMLRAIAADTQYTRDYLGKDRLAEDVMAAMGRVPRHEFVPLDLRQHAYENRPLPIGLGQTISQPYIVALMTDLLGCGPGDTVLEVGTGSGYQAAVLAELVDHVYTIEIVPELGEGARETLERLGYRNVTVRVGDGYQGWPEHAPYDGIIVTAAASHIPQPLIEQLKPGGRLVIPVGLPYSYQELMLVTKDQQGNTHSKSVLGVAFVPLIEERPFGREG
jgi:protein-L-isoaspartate(D-aspartate) O-methyltransferase